MVLDHNPCFLVIQIFLYHLEFQCLDLNRDYAVTLTTPAKMILRIFLPGESPRRFPFSWPNPIVGGMIAQIHIKDTLSLDNGHTVLLLTNLSFD